MADVAAVLAIFLLACASAIATAAVLIAWYVVVDEVGRIRRSRRQRADMGRMAEEILSGTDG